jgi:hypothetical protein
MPYSNLFTIRIGTIITTVTRFPHRNTGRYPDLDEKQIWVPQFHEKGHDQVPSSCSNLISLSFPQSEAFMYMHDQEGEAFDCNMDAFLPVTRTRCSRETRLVVTREFIVAMKRLYTCRTIYTVSPVRSRLHAAKNINRRNGRKEIALVRVNLR